MGHIILSYYYIIIVIIYYIWVLFDVSRFYSKLKLLLFLIMLRSGKQMPQKMPVRYL